MAEGGGDQNPFWNENQAFGEEADTDRNRQHIGDQARVLMTVFIRDRAQADGLGDRLHEEDMYEPGTPRGPAVVGANCEQIGNALRTIGDELDGDDRLQELIGCIGPEAPQDTFMGVAKEIFADGKFNWGRVVMLFYFAYKMAVKAISKAPLIRTIIEWVVKFIKDYVAGWIISRGGWSAIQEYFGSTPGQTVGVFLAGILTAYLYIRWKTR